MSDRIRILLCDDHPLFRAGVAYTLQDEADMDVVGQGASLEEAVRLAGELSPDVVLLDVGIPGGGVQTAAAIAAVCTSAMIIMLTASMEEDDLVGALRAGACAGGAAGVARGRAAASSSLFYVDTLEYLRRGGRIGAAAAILGGALAVKPLLCIEDGKVANLERVRPAARALSRLEDLAVEAAGESPVDGCVAHLANPERAGALADKLSVRLADQLEGREVWCGELGAVLGAHVGPGMVAVCVAPR